MVRENEGVSYLTGEETPKVIREGADILIVEFGIGRLWRWISCSQHGPSAERHDARSLFAIPILDVNWCGVLQGHSGQRQLAAVVDSNRAETAVTENGEDVPRKGLGDSLHVERELRWMRRGQAQQRREEMRRVHLKDVCTFPAASPAVRVTRCLRCGHESSWRT